MRLDQYLAEKYPEHSRSAWQKYITLGYVRIDGSMQTSTKASVSDTNAVAISLPPSPDFSGESLPILYEDDHVVVINKPIGVLSHSKGALNDEFTVAEFFRTRTSYNLDSDRPGIVHRLDRDTSGVMIGAKDAETAKLLLKQFQDRRAKKTYFALTKTAPKPPSAIIDLPIGRSPKHPSTFRVDANGKSALTAYDVMEIGTEAVLVRLRPTTGRTHQLRVHLAYIGTPIIGDRIYGSPNTRMYLHASELEITIPGETSRERRTFTAELPDTFQNKLGNV